MGKIDPAENKFSFNDFIAALEKQESSADLEPYDQLVNALAKVMNVEYQ